MVTTANANVSCQDPARLIRRLCKHWGHKFPVEMMNSRCIVQFPSGSCEFVMEASLLQVHLSVTSDSLSRMQQVVADHLQRMAGEESLAIYWRQRME